jgi:hypothetical protein
VATADVATADMLLSLLKNISYFFLGTYRDVATADMATADATMEVI